MLGEGANPPALLTEDDDTDELELILLSVIVLVEELEDCGLDCSSKKWINCFTKVSSCE